MSKSLVKKLKINSKDRYNVKILMFTNDTILILLYYFWINYILIKYLKYLQQFEFISSFSSLLTNC